MKLPIVLASLFWVSVSAGALPTYSTSIQTSIDSQGAYRSLGTLVLPYPPSAVEARMLDLATYQHWVPRGQDGRDPQSARYIGQVTGVHVAEGGLDFEYRLNLMWPFGASGKRVALSVVDQPAPPGARRRLVLGLKNPSFVVPVLEATFTLLPRGARESVVILDCRMKFAWFLAPFFPLDAYRTEMVQRFDTALGSFARSLEDSFGR